MTVINSLEEAYLLPVGVIIRLAYGDAAVKIRSMYNGQFIWATTRGGVTRDLDFTDYPAIVVWTPGDEDE